MNFLTAIQRGIAAAARQEIEGGDIDQQYPVLPPFPSALSANRPASPVPDVGGQYAMDPLIGAVVVVEEETLPGKNKNDQKWDEMFQKLLDYKEQHGDTMVPQNYKEDPKLGRWVHYQRAEHAIFVSRSYDRQRPKISQERIDRLRNIGFDWDPQETKWNQMYERLKIYQDENLHCRVPKTYAEDPELSHWVRNQRLERRKMERTQAKKGPRNPRLTKDRIQKLDQLGFAWSIASNKKIPDMITSTKSNEGSDSVKNIVSLSDA